MKQILTIIAVLFCLTGSAQVAKDTNQVQDSVVITVQDLNNVLIILSDKIVYKEFLTIQQAFELVVQEAKKKNKIKTQK